jgi:hydroxymethylbilane synthase
MLTIGSRGSNLALSQTGWIKQRILEKFPDAEITVKVIRTSADKDTRISLRAASSTGVFVKEIEDALLAGEVDLAVHSMKDLPTQIPEGLEIAAIPGREDTRDAIIARDPARRLEDLRRSAIVGTGSIRRQSQLLAIRPDLRMVDIRGNVDTRLQKLADGAYDAIVLACAGLNRLGLQDRISFALGFHHMLPAPGQGALALETRLHDPQAGALVAPLHHKATAAAVFAEREFLRRMGGGCNTPVAVFAQSSGQRLQIDGLVAAPDGSRVVRRAIEGTLEEPEEAAVRLADEILAGGGQAILRALG